MVYEFVFDRLRAIRQDIIIQGVCPRVSIALLQPIVRFYAYAGYRLSEEPLSRFDPQINHTHLLECLKTLLSLYNEDVCDCSACTRLERTQCGDKCVAPDGCASCRSENSTAKEENVSGVKRQNDSEHLKARVEMEALYLALNLGSAPTIGRALELGLHSSDAMLGIMLKISLSHWLGHYACVYRNLRQLPPLVLCVAVLHLPAIRRQTLRIMSVAYSSRNLGYSLHKLATLLLYSSDREATNDCRRYNLPVKEGFVMFDKKAFDVAAGQSPLQREPFVEEKLCEYDLPKLLLAT